jgi:hypothetical protein
MQDFGKKEPFEVHEVELITVPFYHEPELNASSCKFWQKNSTAVWAALYFDSDSVSP